MTRCPLRILLTAVACAFALREPQGQLLREPQGQVPQTPQAPAQAPSPPAPGGRQGRGDLDDSADFLKRPPVVRQDPAAQQKLFLLPPGYRIEPVLTDPLIEDPVGVTFDGNGRMYVLEMRSYMQDADGSNVARADQPHLAPRGHRRRRRLRQAHRVRRQPGDAAHCVSARRRRDPRARDRQPRHVQVHRHQRRRRRRQEGAVLCRASAASRTWSGSPAA